MNLNMFLIDLYIRPILFERCTIKLQFTAELPRNNAMRTNGNCYCFASDNQVNILSMPLSKSVTWAVQFVASESLMCFVGFRPVKYIYFGLSVQRNYYISFSYCVQI